MTVLWIEMIGWSIQIRRNKYDASESVLSMIRRNRFVQRLLAMPYGPVAPVGGPSQMDDSTSGMGASLGCTGCAEEDKLRHG